MKIYTCNRCHNRLYFENSVCLYCGTQVGFDAATMTFVTLDASGDGIYSSVLDSARKYTYCANAVYGTCNWVVPFSQNFGFCLACEMNKTIPDLNVAGNLAKWRRIEVAKHRLVYSLLKLNLAFCIVKCDLDPPVSFEFIADTSPKNKVMTGYENGNIRLNINEADETERLKHKLDLGESYRTLLGHLRHESGHYFWEQLVRDSKYLEQFRLLYGDERNAYDLALKEYYQNGPFVNWQNDFISPYATAHPLEDWAETWSHYMLLMDTLETSHSFNLGIQQGHGEQKQSVQMPIISDPYGVFDFKAIFDSWLSLTFAINSLNRSMGYDDFYPFVISPTVVRKLAFIHGICRNGRDFRGKVLSIDGSTTGFMEIV